MSLCGNEVDRKAFISLSPKRKNNHKTRKGKVLLLRKSDVYLYEENLSRELSNRESLKPSVVIMMERS
jgi:hypothetical protein